MLELSNIEKRYGREMILSGISCTLGEREVLCVLGASGCGKTTFLKGIAGLIELDGGTVVMRGRDLSRVPVNERRIIYLSQEAMLFPHMTVRENIGFGLSVRGMAAALVAERVDEMIGLLGLAGLGDRYPEQLSGGQMQRVAFGRALIVQPDVLLLDEPFGHLDAQTRGEMQVLFKEALAAHPIACLFVTHDIREALTVGDRFGYMAGGRLDIFHEKKAFLDDRRSGGKEEWQFWNRQYGNDGR